jgi:hypothetical protein
MISLCVGPSQIFGMPNSLWLMALAQALHGIVSPFVFILVMPEMLDVV